MLRPETTADEIVRWATPVVMFQRTAMDDCEVGGQEVKKGQRVGLVYSSANFDETVFDDPHRFDITRDPNPHVGFGGGGAHFCVGANLAKVEKLRPIAAELGCSLAQMSIAWCAKNPNVSTVITGASRASQVVENFAAIDVIDLLTPEVMERIEHAVR